MRCADASNAKIRKIEALSGKTKEAGKYVFWRFLFFAYTKIYNGNLAQKCLSWINIFPASGNTAGPEFRNFKALFFYASKN